MNKIKTYQDLLETKNQYEEELAINACLIRKDLTDLKEEWRPVTDLLSKFSKPTRMGKINPLVSMGISIIGEVLLKNVLLPQSSWITRFVVPFLATNYSTHILNQNGTSIFSQLIDRFRNRKSNGHLIE